MLARANFRPITQHARQYFSPTTHTRENARRTTREIDDVDFSTFLTDSHPKTPLLVTLSHRW